MPQPQKIVAGILFGTLTTASTALLTVSLVKMRHVNDTTGMMIMLIVAVTSCLFVIRARTVELAMSRGLIILSIGLITTPVHVALHGFVTVAGLFDSSNAGRVFEDAGLLANPPFLGFTIWAMSGVALIIAPVLFVFGWAYGTKGPPH